MTNQNSQTSRGILGEMPCFTVEGDRVYKNIVLLPAQNHGDFELNFNEGTVRARSAVINRAGIYVVPEGSSKHLLLTKVAFEEPSKALIFIPSKVKNSNLRCEVTVKTMSSSDGLFPIWLGSPGETKGYLCVISELDIIQVVRRYSGVLNPSGSKPIRRNIRYVDGEIMVTNPIKFWSRRSG